MSRIFRSTLLVGAAVLSLAACSSDKGPGEIGSKDDIVVRNHGTARAADPAAGPMIPQTGDFTSTIEQGEAVPAPEVAAADALPDTSPAVEQAVAAQQEANAMLSSTTEPAVDSAADMRDGVAPVDAIVPAAPVTETVTPPAPTDYTAGVPQADPSTGTSGVVYPASDYPVAQQPAVSEQQPVATTYEVPAVAPTVAPTVAPAPAPAAIAQPAPLPEGVKYPLDPNAPYSPKAVEAAISAAGATAAPVAAAVTGNPSDVATIRAAQSALKAKGFYAGAETGSVDASFLNALIMYQAQNGLPQGGLNEATLRNLGLIQ